MKKLTLKNLESLKPCGDGLAWYIANKEQDLKKICLKLIDTGLESWCEWLQSRLLSKTNRIKFAIYAAEQVLDIFEKQYPNEKAPRDAIKAAKLVLKNPSQKNKDAANAANAAANAAAYAAYAAANAAARKELQIKIALYGLKLLASQK